MTMFTLADLDFKYDALGKHHQIYVDKLNATIDQAPELKDETIQKLISNLAGLPEGGVEPTGQLAHCRRTLRNQIILLRWSEV